MRKVLSVCVSLCVLFFCLSAGAWDLRSGWNPLSRWYSARQILKGFWQFPSGLTFYKDFSKGIGSNDTKALYADYSVGSPVATFTATRSATAPATYIDTAGKIRLTTTSDVPRITSGYYDSTGFHTAPGIIIEDAKTNMLRQTVFDDNSAWVSDALQYSGVTKWTLALSNGATTVNTLSTDSLYSKSAKIAITNAGSATTDITLRHETRSITSGQPYTVSFYVKTSVAKTITITVERLDNGNNLGLNDTFTTIADTWIRIDRPFTASATSSVAVTYFKMGNLGLFNFQWESMQLENAEFASSYIPTTTASLERGADVLTYPISGNRTADTESVVFKFITGASSGTTTDRVLLGSETISREVKINTGSNDIQILANATVGGLSQVLDVVNENWTGYTSMIIGGSMQHASPYVAGYYNGVADGTNETADDYTNPDWGDSFYIGTDRTPDEQFNGIIQQVAFFNRALTASEHAAVYNSIK